MQVPPFEGQIIRQHRHGKPRTNAQLLHERRVLPARAEVAIRRIKRWQAMTEHNRAHLQTMAAIWRHLPGKAHTRKSSPSPMAKTSETPSSAQTSNSCERRHSRTKRFWAEGTKVILKGLSTVQYNGQAGKILPQRYKSEGGGRREGLGFNASPPTSYRRGAPRRIMAILGICRQQDACHPKTGKSTFRRTHFQQVASRKRRRGRWHGDLHAERRDTQVCSGHQRDPQRSHRTALHWSGWQDFGDCTTSSTTQDRIPVALMNRHRLGVKIRNLETAPTAQSSSLPKITQDVPNTHIPKDCEHFRDHQETHVPGETQAGDQWRGGGPIGGR